MTLIQDHHSLASAFAAPRSAPVARQGALWTSDEDAMLARLRRDGETAEAIALAVGRTRATVYTRLRAIGVVIERHRAWDEAEFARAVEMLRAGARVADAAAAVGRAESELRSRLADRGIGMRALRPKIERSNVKSIAKTTRTDKRLDVEALRAVRLASAERMRAAKAARPTQAIKWTPQRIAELVAAWQAGENDVARLADRFDSTPRMVDTLLREAGARPLKRARAGMTDQKKDEALRRLEVGQTITAIARLLCVDLRTLKAALGDQAASIIHARTLARQAATIAARAARVDVERKARDARRNAERERIEADKARIAVARRAAQARASEEKARASEEKIRASEEKARLDRVGAHKRTMVPRAGAGVGSSAIAAAGAKAAVRRPAGKSGAGDALKAALARRNALASGSSAPAKVLADGGARRQPAPPVVDVQPARVTLVSRAAQDALKPKGPGKPVMFRARRTVQPMLDAAETARLVAAHMADKGVTRIVEIGDEALLGLLRRRGYAVLERKGGWAIDEKFVAAQDLAAFAAARGLKAEIAA